jgi:hypothetical protein
MKVLMPPPGWVYAYSRYLRSSCASWAALHSAIWRPHVNSWASGCLCRSRASGGDRYAQCSLASGGGY